MQVGKIGIPHYGENSSEGNAARTKETRKLLLEAAEKVFIRDGFEKAQVAQIAAAAGRTKGAVYAHFR